MPTSICWRLEFKVLKGKLGRNTFSIFEFILVYWYILFRIIYYIHYRNKKLMYNENITVIQAELHCFILKGIFGQMCLLHKYRSFTWLDYGMKQVAKDIRLPSKNVHRSFSLNITTWTQRFYLGNANMIIIVLFFLWRLSSYLGNKTMQVVTYNLSIACNKHDAWALCLRWGLNFVISMLLLNSIKMVRWE